VLDVLAELSAQAAQIRSEKSRNALLVSKIRSHCLNAGPASDAPGGEGERSGESGIPPAMVQLASHFSRLAEPGRSALALYYVDLFPAGEIANLLHLDLERLGEKLGEARAALRAVAPPAASSEPAGAGSGSSGSGSES